MAGKIVNNQAALINAMLEMGYTNSIASERLFTEGWIQDYQKFYDALIRLQRFRTFDSNHKNIWNLYILSGNPKAIEYSIESRELNSLICDEYGHTVFDLAFFSGNVKQGPSSTLLEAMDAQLSENDSDKDQESKYDHSPKHQEKKNDKEPQEDSGREKSSPPDNSELSFAQKLSNKRQTRKRWKQAAKGFAILAVMFIVITLATSNPLCLIPAGMWALFSLGAYHGARKAGRELILMPEISSMTGVIADSTGGREGLVLGRKVEVVVEKAKARQVVRDIEQLGKMPEKDVVVQGGFNFKP